MGYTTQHISKQRGRNKMENFRVIEIKGQETVDGELVTVFSIVDNEGFPVDYGNFRDLNDAEYVANKINAGDVWGDYAHNLSVTQDSHVYII